MNRSWNLVADIGGTNARFARADSQSGELIDIRHYSVADYARFNDAVVHFQQEMLQAGCAGAPVAACFAVAAPVSQERIQFTNSPWEIVPMELSPLLGGARVDIINDFAAVGYAVMDLTEGDWVQLGGSEPRAHSPIGVLGPGTGLGMCCLMPSENGFSVIEGEGGHVEFAPINDEEIEVLRFLIGRFGHVSVERLLSGMGLLNIYDALISMSGQPASCFRPEEVTDAAIAGTDPICEKTLSLFCGVLGAVAGNLALTIGARGGIYIAGGIAQRFVPYLTRSPLRARFEDKGRFEGYLKEIPIRLVTRQNLGLIGASRALR